MSSSLRPYSYWEENGQYFFDTPSGAQYVAYFLELPFAEDLYTFNFEKLHRGKYGVVDCHVFDTICHFLWRFFQNHRNSMLIACDTADGREKARMRLFESWYKRMAPNGISKIDRHGKADNYELFLSLLVWDHNPNKAKLLSILEDYCETMLL